MLKFLFIVKKTLTTFFIVCFFVFRQMGNSGVKGRRYIFCPPDKSGGYSQGMPTGVKRLYYELQGAFQDVELSSPIYNKRNNNLLINQGLKAGSEATAQL
jgi:hypothetical protein